ncbi:MAG: hypothetical protein V4649_18975 [Bacteroidota bacterium]
MNTAVFLLITAFILAGWIILGYALITRRPTQFMPRSYRYILLTSMVITSLLWWMDDDPPYPNILHTLAEIPVVGTMYTGLFFLVIGGVNWLANKLSR